jgi:hypothetical protein
MKRDRACSEQTRITDSHLPSTPAGFIRVRERTLPEPWPSNACRNSRSFNLVRSVRINGKPRQRFVAGLGYQRDAMSDWDIGHFWHRAFLRLRRHRYDTHRLADEMVRKGARLPVLACIEQQQQRFSLSAGIYADIAAWLTTREARQAA